MNMAGPKARWLLISMMLLMALPALVSSQVGSPAYAQGDSRTFPETGHTVKGKFLAYWNAHGGLAQQGFPISEEMQEVSDTNGKTYTMQYFERAIFEMHPENQPPNDVLLSLLGVFLYQQKYPNGAPNQVVNADLNFRDFPETGHRVGGLFLDYWNSHGALPQQGFPISDEFTEVNQLDGKPYKVQYFERAVFEYHPEQSDPQYKVLLSQLGTFRYRAKHGGGPGAPTATPVKGGPQPTATPVRPQPSPTPKGATCDPSGSITASATPNRVKPGDTITFEAWGFNADENVSFWFTEPHGNVAGTPNPLCCAGSDGHVHFSPLQISSALGQDPGRWAITVQGQDSNHVSVAYFCVSP